MPPRFCSTHSKKYFMGSNKLVPKGVNSYSTRGGTSGNLSDHEAISFQIAQGCGEHPLGNFAELFT